MSLEKFSDIELEQELLRRKKLAGRPELLEEFDLSALKEVCQEYIELVATDKDQDSDIRHYIFERTITTLYGEEAWTWINKQ